MANPASSLPQLHSTQSRHTPCMVRLPLPLLCIHVLCPVLILSILTDTDSCLSVSPGPMPQQYPHPSATLHPHPQHPQPSATPTGQGQQGGPPQHGGPPSHPAASPVQHPQHQQAAAGEQAVKSCFDTCTHHFWRLTIANGALHCCV